MVKSSVSVLIPAYNEEEVIEHTVLELKKYLSSLHSKKLISSYEIIICVNGSTDRTLLIAKRLSKKHKEIKYTATKKKGMGLALRNGVKAASKDIVTFIAADGESLNDIIERSVIALRNNDFVSGSRYLVKNQIRGSNFLRMFLSMGFALFIRIFFSPKFTEVGTVKAFKREWGQKVIGDCKRNDASWQVEILYYALKSRLKVKEIPVYIKIKRFGRASKVKIIKEIYSFFKTTLKFSIMLRMHQLKRFLGF